MRTSIKKAYWAAYLLVMICMPLDVYAQSGIQGQNDMAAEDTAPVSEPAAAISINEAIRLGLANSVVLKQVQNEIDISKAYDSQALSDKHDLIKGEKDIVDADDDIKRGKRQLSTAKDSLEAAQALLDEGKAPEAVTIPGEQTGLPVNITVGAGEDIYSASYNTLTGMGIDEHTANTYATAVTAAATGEIQARLDEKAEEIDSGYSKLSSAMNHVDNGREKLDRGLGEAEESISKKLETYDASELNLDDAANLIASMAGINYDVTAYSYTVYRNKLALLIEKDCLDVLKCKKTSGGRGEFDETGGEAGRFRRKLL